MATFITSKSVGQTIRIRIDTSAGYWKYNHNGTDSNLFTSGNDQTITVENANGEFTIIPCDITGNPSGNITSMVFGSFFGAQDNRIISFDGTGLTGLTFLSLQYNQITSLDNFIFPSSLITLNLSNNQLTSFNRTGLTSLTDLYLTNNQLTSIDVSALTNLTVLMLTNNQLTSFNGTGLTNLTRLELHNNQLTSIDVSPLTNLNTLFVNDNLLDSVDNDLILSQLVANGRYNGNATTSGGRTSAGTNDFMTLQSRGWNLQGFNDNTTTTTTTTTTSAPPTQPVTFITSKSVGQTILIWSLTTSTGYWKYYHNGTYSSVFTNSFFLTIPVTNVNGEFTLIPCLSDGTPSGDLFILNLSSNQLTSFNGTGLTSLSQLVINDNQLTSIDVSPLTSLNGLSVSSNLLDSVDNDLILSQLVANSRREGNATTSGGITSAGTNDFMTLQSRGWNLQGFNDNVTTTTTTTSPTTTTTTTSPTTTTTTTSPITTTTTTSPITTTTTTSAPVAGNGKLRVKGVGQLNP
jgi:Leucine-rich repeat (LRR) protein